VLMPDIDTSGAIVFAERLRLRIESLVVTHEKQAIPFTISLGVADLSFPTDDHKQLIERADQALYASKKGGRNQTNSYKG
jgi:diguanylate cyclase (GGDEF)-like protein